jgi:HAD superfamily hydrolase (TIGR01484 family)
MKKVIVFDLDGTLAPSKSSLPDEMEKVLAKLLDRFQICVISGGKFEQFNKQLIPNLKVEPSKLERLHIMPTCGTQYYTYEPRKNVWRQVYAENLSTKEKQDIQVALNKGLDDLNLRADKVYGEIIEDRGSQITVSVLGQDIVEVLGEKGVAIKEAWDPDNKKKQAFRDYVAALIPHLEVKVGGLTSIDVTKPGIDKAYGMKKLIELLGINKEDILFFGDRLQEGGNDYPVKAMGIDSLEVSHWQDTVLALRSILHVI